MREVFRLGDVLRLAVVFAGLVGVWTLYVRWFTPWQRVWGTRPDEASGLVEGDDLLEVVRGQAKRAVTIDAPPECVWPWLVQMGHGRGGLYSWDALDIAFGILDRRSAKAVLPEFQQLAEGDVVPVKRGPDFAVLRVVPGKALVLGSGDPAFPVTWQTELRPLEGGRTRLVTRNRIDPPGTPIARVLVAILDIAAFVMVTRWLQVLKERAEGLASGKYSSAGSSR